MREILVVDDSKVARRIVVKCLKIVGFDDSNFPEAENGAEALEYLKEQDVDLIVTDLNMPVMDGVSLVRRVRSNPRLQHIPVVVVSSLLNDDNKQALRERGVEHLIEKPLSPASLSNVIEAIGKDGP